MMKVTLPEGTSLTGTAETIVRLFRDTHWSVGEQSIQVYMERVREDAKRLYGIDIRTDGPTVFLVSLASHNMITIEEAA